MCFRKHKVTYITKASRYAMLKLGWANEVSKGGVGGVVAHGPISQSLVGESEEERWPGGSENE